MTPKAGAYHKNVGNKAYRDKYDDIFRKKPEIYPPEELKRLKATVMSVDEFEEISRCRDTAGLFCQCNTCKEIRKKG